MAITAILLGLIFGPLVQSFNLTNRARVQVETQDVVRRVSELGQRDLAQAVFVFDNSTQPINFWVRKPDNQGNPTGNPVVEPIPFAWVDMVAPAHVRDQDPNPQIGEIDPTTGLVQDRGGVSLPLAPGRVIIRYFLGLRDNATANDTVYGTSGVPLKPYTNFYDNPRIASVNTHNPFILYRAVVSPYTAGGAVDTRLFRTDAGGNPILYDPNFFYDNTVAVKPNDPAVTSAAMVGWKDDNKDGKVNMSENWKAIARAIVPTDRSDEAVVERGADGKPLFFPDPVTGPYMKIDPLVKFQPSYVGNDAGVPSSTTDTGNEEPNVPPSAHRETFGYWTLPYNLYVYRGSLANPVLNYFFWDGGTGPIEARTYDTTNNTQTTTPARFYPKKYDPTKTYIDPANPPLDINNPPSMMFTVDSRRGLVNFAFPDRIFLYDNTGYAKPSQWKQTAANPDVANINANFDTAVANQNPSAIRFISLKNLPDGRTSPLSVIPNCYVVPGSELVIGPDMRPGPHYGRSITYTRVPRSGLVQASELGPNEYQINYYDIPNANFSTPEVMNHAIQAAGTIIFNSKVSAVTDKHDIPVVDNNGNPADPIIVTYQMQNNLQADTVKADYLTRQLMTFSLGARLYEFNSGQPQQVTLTQKVDVRNLQR
jgi:hypothetical protein